MTKMQQQERSKERERPKEKDRLKEKEVKGERKHKNLEMLWHSWLSQFPPVPCVVSIERAICGNIHLSP